MTIERKDLRLKLDADDHAGLQLLAEADEVDLSEWAERLLKHEIRDRLHKAMVLAAKAQRLGIAGNAIPGDR